MFTRAASAATPRATYWIDSLPADPFDFVLQCTRISGGVKELVSKYVTPEKPTAILRQNWTVSGAGCDRRSVRHVEGIFRGYYTHGLEATFVPCRSDAWYQLGDSLERVPAALRGAWVTWRRGRRDMSSWPATDHDSSGNPRFFVRWQGRLQGPGHYGHFNLQAFAFDVDSLLEVRPARLGDCSP